MKLKEQHPEVLDDVLKRMRRIEGQARGIQRMLENGEDCDAILIQLSAMRSAINKVGLKVIGCHLGARVCEEIGAGGTGQQAVEEMLEDFMRLG